MLLTIVAFVASFYLAVLLIFLSSQPVVLLIEGEGESSCAPTLRLAITRYFKKSDFAESEDLLPGYQTALIGGAFCLAVIGGGLGYVGSVYLFASLTNILQKEILRTAMTSASAALASIILPIIVSSEYRLQAFTQFFIQTFIIAAIATTVFDLAPDYLTPLFALIENTTLNFSAVKSALQVADAAVHGAAFTGISYINSIWCSMFKQAGATCCTNNESSVDQFIPLQN